MKTLAFGLALTAGCAAPAFATTMIENSVASGTSVTIGATSDSDTALQNLGAAPGQANASSVSAVTTSSNSATAFASISANWLSADAGTVGIEWGWRTSSWLGPLTMATNLSRPQWTYTFIASGDGTFDVTGSVVATGNFLFGLGPIYVTGFGFDEIGGNFADPNGSDSLSFAIAAGQQYTVGISNYGNVTGDGFLTDSLAEADIAWAINYAGVPEPEAWALLILGFGVTGAAMRRRARGGIALA